MTPLKPTPELVAAARRIAAREWTLSPNDSYSPDVDRNLWLLVMHRLACLHFAQPRRQQDGTDSDRWALTPAGREWLRDAEAEAMWGHTSGVNP